MNQVSIELLASAMLRTAGVTLGEPAYRRLTSTTTAWHGEAYEQPDPAYWTDYDRYMIVRETRARRRADFVARVRAWAGSVFQHLRRGAPAFPVSGLSPLR